MAMFFNGRPLPGLIISGKNTYEEWDMIPTSRLSVKEPEVKTTYVDLPGADGGLDYTELLTGKPNYGYRKGSWEFFLIPGDSWADVKRSLSQYLHGKYHAIVLEGDPHWKYTGRLQISEWQSAAHNSTITIDYILDPNPVDISEGDPVDYDLEAAGRVLRRQENNGKFIMLDNGEPILVPMYQDGDDIYYPVEEETGDPVEGDETEPGTTPTEP